MGRRALEGGGAYEQVVQWFPGHIARAQRELQATLGKVDLVVEVRDARAAFASEHPDLNQWLGGKPRVVLLNRRDMVSAGDRDALARHFAGAGERVLWTDGKTGAGLQKVRREAERLGRGLNRGRAGRQLRPRPVRCAVLGFPNVGKSAVINRLLGRRACPSHNKPGLTRQLRWVSAGEALQLLDSPGVLPSRLADQRAAQRLAICNDIGEASYLASKVAATMVEELRGLPEADAVVGALRRRYPAVDPGPDTTGEAYVAELAQELFNGDLEGCARRLLRDYRRGALGFHALEHPGR